MQEITVALDNPQVTALDTALRAALGSKCSGVSTYGTGRPVSIWLDDTAVQADIDTATAIATAHDPVFLTASKSTIAADGVDTATITVQAPKSGAAAVTLLMGSTPVPVTLAAGVGTVVITSLDPTVITVTVQTPANRTTDTLTIQAV